MNNREDLLQRYKALVFFIMDLEEDVKGAELERSKIDKIHKVNGFKKRMPDAKMDYFTFNVMMDGVHGYFLRKAALATKTFTVIETLLPIIKEQTLAYYEELNWKE